jgi:hypothetical protein
MMQMQRRVHLPAGALPLLEVGAVVEEAVKQAADAVMVGLDGVIKPLQAARRGQVLGLGGEGGLPGGVTG